MEFRLEKLLRQQDGHGFWILALMLMDKSVVLRLVCLRKLDKNWFKRWSLSKVSSFLGYLNTMIQNLDVTSFIVRHYVPKGEKGHRPIGSPSFPDRMFLYLWQCFFVMFFTAYISPHQHAYMPGKGTLTALSDIAEQISNPKWTNIWEFDLQGAFPSVRVSETCDELARRGVPHHIASLIKYMGLSTIERVDLSVMGRLLEEPKFDVQSVLMNLDFKPQRGGGSASRLMTGFISKVTSNPEGIKERMARLFSDPTLALAHIGDKEALETMVRLSPKDVPFTLDLVEAPVKLIKDLIRENPNHLVGKGFPQGSGLSPILFNFAFETMMNRVHFENKKYLTQGDILVVSYADDFLLFSTEHIPWEILTNMPFKPLDRKSVV